MFELIHKFNLQSKIDKVVSLPFYIYSKSDEFKEL